MNDPISRPISRRRFVSGALAGACSAGAAPYLIPASALGAQGRTAPSNRITMGLIGCGGMGNSNLNAFLRFKDVRVLAVCDVDQNHLKSTQQRVNQTYKNQDCAAYEDFRELIARPDIDAILLCTPDHWHAIPAILGAEAGKDIYGEKPLTHHHAEGVALVNAVRRHGRIWQTGSWQRSQDHFRIGAQIVRNGWIGKIHTVEVGLPAGRTDKGVVGNFKPPALLNYDLWVGPAPWNEYVKDRVHFDWRWHMDYGGSQLMDWIGHHNDIAHWGLGDDDAIGPDEIETKGKWLTDSDVWNHCYDFQVHCRYPQGVTTHIASAPHLRMGTKWIGADGWVYVNRGGKIETSNRDLLRQQPGPNELHLAQSPGHQRQFIDCVKTRQRTLTPAEVAHRSITPGHLGLISLRLGRKIRWEPKTETILGDATANRMLGRACRAPWSL